MKGFYDQILPAAANKLVKKFGARVGEGEVSTGERDYFVRRDGAGWYRILLSLPNHIADDRRFPTRAAAQEYADSLNKAGNAKAVHTLDITPQLREAATSQGFPLFQGAQGKVRIREGLKPVITLFEQRDASTAIHELGHVWLEEMMQHSELEQAPDILKTDAKTIRDWLGVETANDIKTSHHEKFARGFEQYMREGVAPSPGLANVFAKFRDWMLRIYQTLKGLGPEIPPQIRDVFDRMLALEPQRTVISPELETRPALPDIHEADLAETPPHEAEGAGDRAELETQRYVHDIAPEIKAEYGDSLPSATARTAADTPAEVRAGEPAGEPVGGAGEQAGPKPAGGAESAERGAELQGGGGNVPEGADLRGGIPPIEPGLRRTAGAIDVTVDSHVPFDSLKPADTDKIGNIRLENLNTSADVNQAIRELYTANKDRLGAATRGVVTDQTVISLADSMGVNPALVADNMARLRDMSVQDNVPLAARIWLMREVFTRLAADVRTKMEGTDEAAYAEARQRFLMAHETLTGITAEVGRGLRAFRTMKEGEAGQAMDLATMLQAQTGKTLFQLQQEMRLGRAMENPAQVARFVNDMETTLWQKIRAGIISYAVNNLISGPLTHGAYVVGNKMVQLFKAVPVTALAATEGAVREALGQTVADRVYYGEIGAQLYGLLHGLREGILSRPIRRSRPAFR